MDAKTASSDLQIFDCEQCSPEWYEARLGIPTASQFKTVLAKGKDGKTASSKTRADYMRKLAGERITGEPMDSYSNAHMERGKEMEAEARELYIGALNMSEDPPEVRQVGFVRNVAKGCSPDCLIGDSGMLEVKTAFAHILIEHMMKGKFPTAHLAQCQGQIWVAEREWCDLVIYWPRMPVFQMRLYRDPEYIAMLEHAVDRFNQELEELVEKVRRYAG